MALGHPTDLTQEYKQNIYNITIDVSGYDKVGVQLVAPLAGPISVYGTNDGGALHSVRDGNAELATNFTAILATSLSTGTAGNTMATAGGYTVPVDLQYMRFAGGGADVYKLLVFETKVS